MSGGHWNYLSHRIEERFGGFADIGKILAWIEHEIDWGVSGDTCQTCAEKCTFHWVCVLFDHMNGEFGTQDAIDKMDEIQKKNMCERCAALAVTLRVIG